MKKLQDLTQEEFNEMVKEIIKMTSRTEYVILTKGTKDVVIIWAVSVSGQPYDISELITYLMKKFDIKASVETDFILRSYDQLDEFESEAKYKYIAPGLREYIKATNW